jgi:hypothetical protein
MGAADSAACRRSWRVSTAGSPRIGRGSSKRPQAQSLPGLLRRERAQPDPQCAPTWAPRGQPPTLTHPFNWKKASMAAAICYGVAVVARAGLPRPRGQLRHRQPDRSPWGAATLPWRGEGDAAVGRAARPPQHGHARLAAHPTPLAGGRAAARLRARPEPGGGPVVVPEGRGAGQPHLADPGRGDPPGPPRHPARPPHAHLGYSFLQHAGLSVS